MVYVHKSFLFPNTSNFFYLECDMLILYTPLGLIKIKNDPLNKSFINDGCFFFFKTVLNLDSLLYDLFKWSSTGFMHKYRMRGLGYRQFTYYGDLIKMRLRYSHVLFRFLPYSLLTFCKKKLRKFYGIYGLDRQLVTRYAFLFTSFRVANIYTKKGFFKRNTIVKFKAAAKRDRNR